jgi:transketolase
MRYNASKPAVEHKTPYEIGRAEVIAEGSDVTLLTYGFLLQEAEKARQILEAKKIATGLVNLRSLKPIDEKVVLEAARRSRTLVTVEDHFLAGGLYSIVAELFLRRGTTARVVPMALEERWFKPALLADVLRHEGFTGEQLAERVQKALG